MNKPNFEELVNIYELRKTLINRIRQHETDCNLTRKSDEQVVNIAMKMIEVRRTKYNYFGKI